MLHKILELIEAKKFAALKEELKEMRAVDIAEIFEELDVKYCIIIFRLLPKDFAADVFAYLSSQQRKDIVAAIHEKHLNDIIDELYFDDMIDFLEEMPANVVKRILLTASDEERKLINQFLNYPENSAGSLMTIEYVDLKKEMTIKQALDHIKKTGVDKETIYTSYVLDEKRKLEGIISLRKLVLLDENLLISDVMNDDFITTTTFADQEEVVVLFKKYDLLTVPVVDKEGRLVGIITIDDIVDVIDQENTEDFQKMAAMTPMDEEYLNSSVFSLARRRIVWLLILMITATFTEMIIGRYEEILTAVAVLAASIPMLMDTAGNAGSQSSTLIIRGIALGEVQLTDYLKVFFKEFRVSLIVGASLAIVNITRMLVLGNPLNVSFTVSITLLLTIMMAKMVGGTLPIIAKKLKLDPAIMAGPLITTIVDVMALLVYFNIAGALIGF
ncbi:magnesium transporter [Serpentinicella alkaliphila]|uniref:Magnesium transporter MgtE n=1 Tax=Serpentinicella alkaliphila TaxID=1734049 RepID=A0A4R2TME1_9FIRM|nr:magnesium transporter [Serpentinicella alkaliphila]QUH24547.1 magnesium transporter [Serpentinicella alkaliphila]TCQ04641.1 magnesium transporter [Serpentinicella alkaliphila]